MLLNHNLFKKTTTFSSISRWNDFYLYDYSGQVTMIIGSDVKINFASRFTLEGCLFDHCVNRLL